MNRHEEQREDEFYLGLDCNRCETRHLGDCPEELGEPLPPVLRTTDDGLRIVDEDAMVMR